MTGGRNGEVDLWLWKDGTWSQQRLQDAQQPRDTRWPGIVWVTYRPTSIVAIAALARSKTWLSLTAGGELVVWKENQIAHVWQLPVPGWPRSLATHPSANWIAVGLKQGGFGAPASTVLLVEADN